MYEETFRSLNFLIFRDNSECEIEPDSFNGLSELRELVIENSSMQNIDQTFMASFAHNLTRFRMISSYCHNTINILTGNVPLSSLTYFHLESTQLSLGVLGAHNISGLVGISELNMINCGIYAIEETTFNFLNKTLCLLNLRNNRLKTLGCQTFDELLKYGTEFEYVWLSGNPWKCNSNTTAIYKKLSTAYPKKGSGFDFDDCARYDMKYNFQCPIQNESV